MIEYKKANKSFLVGVLLVLFVQGALLSEKSYITGRVTDKNGNGIIGIPVFLYSLDKKLITTVQTENSGRYVIREVTEGAYKIKFSSPEKKYVTEWYQKKKAYAHADIINVKLNQPVLRMNSVLYENSVELYQDMDIVVAEKAKYWLHQYLNENRIDLPSINLYAVEVYSYEAPAVRFQGCCPNRYHVSIPLLAQGKSTFGKVKLELNISVTEAKDNWGISLGEIKIIDRIKSHKFVTTFFSMFLENIPLLSLLMILFWMAYMCPKLWKYFIIATIGSFFWGIAKTVNMTFGPKPANVIYTIFWIFSGIIGFIVLFRIIKYAKEMVTWKLISNIIWLILLLLVFLFNFLGIFSDLKIEGWKTSSAIIFALFGALALTF